MKKMKQLLSVLMAGVMTVSMMGTVAFAEESAPGYQAQDTYILNFIGNDLGYTEGIPAYQYLSPYKGKGTVNLPTGNTNFNIQGQVFNLYNTETEDNIATYCTDVVVGLDHNSYFQRMNLEDSVYGVAAAGKLRAIVLNGFPHTDYETIGAAAGVEDLSLCEAITATQFAIWTAVHGSDFTINDFYKDMTSDSKWDAADDKLSQVIMFYEACRAELNAYKDAGLNPASTTETGKAIEARIIAAYNYLLSLDPIPFSENGIAASAASFKEWSDAPVLIKNEDGTYNVTVSTKVDVEMNGDTDALTLSAVLDNKAYFASTNLSDGEAEYTLTIENVPAEAARGAVTLAIDGMQTVSNVFLFDAKGDRGASQSLIGLDDSQLPVHAEVKVEPERIINFYKTTKIVTGQDAETGEEVYTLNPLEGIKFDLYLAATLDEYLKGTELKEPSEFEFPTSRPDGINGILPVVSVTTDAEGKASISLTKHDLPDGVYLVKEREHTAIKAPVAPFYIMIPYTNTSGNGWEYVVDIQPKNEVLGEIEIDKDVISVGQDEASVNAYDPHTWIIGASIPLDIADGKEYKISDTLDNRLDFLNNVKVQVEDSQEGTTNAPVALTAGTDYVLSVVDNDSLAEDKPSDSFTIELTKIGMKKVSAVAGYDIIRVYFDAQINANAQMGENIENQAHLDYTNSVNFDFDADSDKPFVNTGAANLLKVDGNTEKVDDNVITYEKKLAGATFQVYRAATVAEIEDADVVKTHVDGIDAPVVLVEFFDNAALTGEKVTSVTSDTDGKVAIYGLAYGNYYLVETNAPEGYNLMIAPAELTINDTSHTDASVITIENFGGFELPETGGIGTTIYTLMGSMTMAASSMYIFRKKRED